MKKQLWATLLTTALAAGMAMAVSAADPSILWDFGEDEEMSEYMSGAANVMYYGEEDYYAFMATGQDPYVTMNTPTEDVTEVQWAKIRVKNPSTATAVELFGATNGRGLTGPECTHINIESECNEWRTYIINVFESNLITANTYKGQSLETTYWMGTVDSIRLDPMWKVGGSDNDEGGSMEPGEEIYIDYVAFFAEEKDAIAFRAEQDAASTMEQFHTDEAVVPNDLSIAAEVDTSSPDPTIVWNFGADAEMDAAMGTGSSVEWTAEEDYYVFTAKGGDPNVVINTPADDARLIQWAKVRVKNPGTATAIELFAATNYRSLSGPECTHIDIEPNSNEWKTYTVYLPDANVATANTYKGASLEKTYWEGTVQSIRLDPMWQADADGNDAGGSMTDGDQIYIDYIAFFANEDAANAFDPTAVVEAPETEAPETEAPETEAPETEAEVVETAAPETEAPETEAEVVETAAPETAAPETTTSTTAPATFDAGIIVAAAAVVSAAGYAISRKRK